MNYNFNIIIMLEVILCTCGKNLGCLINLYDFVWEKIKRDYKSKEAPNVAIDRVQWETKWQVEAGPLLDLVGCKLECCRMNMLSRVKISELR